MRSGSANKGDRPDGGSGPEPSSPHASGPSVRARYIQLFVLILAGGAIYPVLYMRQNFEVSLLETFSMTQQQLGTCYSILGVLFFVTYLPSGWLADRFRPRWLLASSMLTTGMLALWFATVPDFAQVRLIFAGWGITTGLTFWGAMIKGVSLLAPPERQGTFFGLLEAGRGAVEALLATLALALFAYLIEQNGSPTQFALQSVIVFYGATSIALASVILLCINVPQPTAEAPPKAGITNQLTTDLRALGANPRLWLAGCVVLCGYQIFWATYSFSGLLQSTFGLGAVAAGTITVAKLWMRPIGAALAGIIGDRLHAVRMLAWLMLLSAAGLVILPWLPPSTGPYVLVPLILGIGLVTYGIRGIYWATLEDCGIPAHTRGLAIGLISLIGYTPDIYLPILQSACFSAFEGRMAYVAYYGVLSAGGVVGALAALKLSGWQSDRDMLS